jgi:signal transduction histidine kinase
MRVPISLHTGEPSATKTSGELVDQLQAALHRNEKLALVGKLTAAAIHEINNPAEAVTNLAYLILQHPGDPGLVAAFATQIEEQMIRIQYATRQTLSYFRETPQRQRVDLVSVVEAALRFHNPLLSQRNIHVRKQLPGELIADIFPGDFLQMLSNLICNAGEALPDGGLLIIRMRAVSNAIRLTVADNGCGIPHTMRPHLFEPFQSTKAERGNGLGLWICKSIAAKHGGSIVWRTSTAQNLHGTAFSISLAS